MAIRADPYHPVPPRVERARALDRGLDVLPREMLDPHYADVIARVLALDPDDAGGLRTKYALLRDPAELARVRGELEALVQRHAGAQDWEALHEAMETALARYGALRELAQFTLLFRAVAELELGRLDAGLATLWLRASAVGAFPVGAIIFHLLGRVLRPELEGLRRLVPAAYLKSGHCYEWLDEKNLAEKTFRDLIAKHPNTEEAEQARAALKDMGG